MAVLRAIALSEDLADRVGALVDEHEARLGVQRGGRATPKVLHQLEPELAETIRLEVEALTHDRFGEAVAWAVEMGEGDAIDWHDHHQADVCAVCYLQAEGEGGELEFESGERIAPEPGRLVIFGPFDRHRVLPARGRRLSVAVNLRRGAAPTRG